MHVIDVNGDGRSDIVTTMAHSYGVLWFEQRPDGGWVPRAIDTTWANAHSTAMADLNGDGQLDLIAAKRYWGRNGTDPAEREPMGIYWYEFRPGLKDTVEWIRHIVDYGGRAGGGQWWSSTSTATTIATSSRRGRRGCSSRKISAAARCPRPAVRNDV